VLHAARWKCRTQKKSPKVRHLRTIAQICQAISSQLRHVSTIGKKLVKQQCLSTCPHNMVNFGPLTPEICWRGWGTPVNSTGFASYMAGLLHATLLVGALAKLCGVEQTPLTAPLIFGRAAITLGIGPHSS